MTAPKRPLASVVMPVYRNQPYLKDALQSVLAQDYSPLEIIIQDDASPDDAFEVIQRIVDAYDGPHQVITGTNARNMSMANYNVLMDKASADYIIVAHDDDIQYPDRVSRIMDTFLTQNVSMVTSNAICINAAGDVLGPDLKDASDSQVTAETLAAVGWTQQTHGAVLSWHRDVFDRFGPIDIDGTARTSDFVIPYRAALLKGIHYLASPTLSRRVHLDSRGSIGRNTDDTDIYTVEDCSEAVTQLVYMLKTTNDAADRGIIDQDTAVRLTQSLRDVLVARCASLARSRNRLHMKKLRMTWISHAAGAVTEADVPNLGLSDDKIDLFMHGSSFGNLHRKLSKRHQVVRAINGPAWYWVAAMNPFRVRYWRGVRQLQQQLRDKP